MKEFELPLSKDYQRPVINTGQIDALVDTGAMIPTFSIPSPYIHMMESAFKAHKIKEDVGILGFGGECKGSIYEMPSFSVGDLKYEPFQFFVPDVQVTKEHPFLLSASMFYGTDYDFNTIDGKFIVKVNDETDLTRSFLLKDLNGQLYAQIGDVLLQEPSMDIIREPENFFQVYKLLKTELGTSLDVKSKCDDVINNMSASVKEQSIKQQVQSISNNKER